MDLSLYSPYPNPDPYYRNFLVLVGTTKEDWERAAQDYERALSIFKDRRFAGRVYECKHPKVYHHPDGTYQCYICSAWSKEGQDWQPMNWAELERVCLEAGSRAFKAIQAYVGVLQERS